MSHANGIISAPISLHADVYPVLGLAKTGTYYDVAYACGNEHGKINKWSKHKPVRYDSPSELTNAQWESALYGMGVTYSSNIDTVIESALSGDWEYLPPRPGTDWCRLTDFKDYNHSCLKPCTNKLMNQQGEDGQSAFGQVMFQDESREAGEIHENLVLREISVNGVPFSDCYFCVVTIDKDGRKIQGNTSEKVFGTNNNLTYLYFYKGDFSRGDYTMVPLISSVKRSPCRFCNGENWSDGWYATLPTRPGTLSIGAWDDIDFRCEAEWVYDSQNKRSAINYDLYYTNRTSQPVNIGAVTIKCGYYDRRVEYDPVKVYLWNGQVDSGRDIVIPANVEDADPRLGGSINERMIGESFNDEDYFIELTFETDYVEDWAYDVKD